MKDVKDDKTQGTLRACAAAAVGLVACILTGVGFLGTAAPEWTAWAIIAACLLAWAGFSTIEHIASAATGFGYGEDYEDKEDEDTMREVV